ncbi:MAG: Fe-S protein assembly co-chaperone HscB [Saprospiraceae bacterium]
MPTYFELFGIPESITVDETALKKQFYALSRKLHPDQSSSEEQLEMERQSAELNKGYEVLRHLDTRVKYWLECQRMMPAEGSHKMSPAFLAEMMDFNEEIMELELSFDKDRYQRLQNSATELQKNWEEDFLQIATDDQLDTQIVIEAAQKYFFQNRYLLRILENLNKFANF